MHSPAFSLQRVSGNQVVDWDAVDDELDKIPSELKDPRFDSLRHVLNILSAVDAEAALEEVIQFDTVDCSKKSDGHPALVLAAAKRTTRYYRRPCG